MGQWTLGHQLPGVSPRTHRGQVQFEARYMHNQYQSENEYLASETSI